MKTIVIVIGTAAALVMPPGSALAQDAKAEQGMKVFVAQKCTQCHSIGDRGSKKGPLDDVGNKLSAAEIREWIVDPVGMAAKTKPTPTRKPAMKKKPMSGGDVDALVALLTNLKS